MKEVFKIIGTTIVYMIDFISIIIAILYLKEIPENTIVLRLLLAFVVMHLFYNIVIRIIKYLKSKQ